MKRNFSSRLLPVAVFVFAITGAIATNAMEKRNASNTALVSGYEKIGSECVFRNQCENTERSFMCTVGNVNGTPQLYGIDPVSGDCNLPLWRP